MRIAGGRPGGMQSGVCLFRSVLEHDPEKWIPVFGKDHAPPIGWSGMTIRRKVNPALESQATANGTGPSSVHEPDRDVSLHLPGAAAGLENLLAVSAISGK